MIEFKIGKCPKCGKLAEIIISNNPIVAGVCLNCLKRELDPSKLEQADFFCRTYNLSFNPNLWMDLYEKYKDDVFKYYVQQSLSADQNNLYYKKVTSDLWKKADEEWEKSKTFETLLNKIDKIKDSFILRNQIKWGPNYTFEEYVQLENLLISTLRANDITNPLQIDSIKKACKISIALDKAIKEGNSKDIKEFTAAYTNFVKTAQIDNIIAAANNDTITTVADLAEEIEKCGGQFKFYDNVERDIVDKTINDIKTYIKTLVLESTGLTSTFELISQNYKNNVEQEATDEATSKVSIDDIIKNTKALENKELDEEVSSDDLEDLEIEDDDDDLF